MTLSDGYTEQLDHREHHLGMNKEVFGIFGDPDGIDKQLLDDQFDKVVSGQAMTVGVRDATIGLPGRTDVYQSTDGLCVLWGETVAEPGSEPWTARRILSSFASTGTKTISEMNGSYLLFLEHDDQAIIAPDTIRSWECFYADGSSGRVFGTDAKRVADHVRAPTIDFRGVNELMHIGVISSDRTMLQELKRIPFDHLLTPDDTIDLHRFVYRPRSGSKERFARSLAVRLERAIRLRSQYPPPRGILASAGFDSRLLLAELAPLDRCYTLGEFADPEVAVARKLANQYDTPHRTLQISRRYLDVRPGIIQYGNGIRESLHIHHRGNMDQFDVQTMYHGLLLDTILRDIYLSRRTMDLVGLSLPLTGLKRNPDPLSYFKKRLEVLTTLEQPLIQHQSIGEHSATSFVDSVMESTISRAKSRDMSIHNTMAKVGVMLVPALPFRTHIADHFVESLIAADTGLIDWHLTTPPEHRNGDTFQTAIEMIDSSILDHRPPDRPYRSYTLNSVHGFIRRNTPFLDPIGTPWPNRDLMYEETNMDEKLFADMPSVQQLPTRVKLRIHDALTWLSTITHLDEEPRKLIEIIPS